MSDAGADQELDLSNSDVVTKYKAAAEIANAALKAVIEECKPGAKLVDVCAKGDAVIEDLCSKVYKGKKLEKGSAFPTCLSVNSVVGHYCPLADDATTLADGDVVKIDLGAHIDGWIAVVGHTLVIGPVAGRDADLLAGAATAMEAALRCVRPGKKLTAVAPVLEQVAAAYGLHVVEAVLSHKLSQFVIDGDKCLLSRHVDDGTGAPPPKDDGDVFEENEAWAVDVVLSTGDGRAKVLDEKATTVYKRALDGGYSLKLKAARGVLSEVSRRFSTMPFALRSLETPGARLGLVECVNHGLLHSYPVLHEKPGAKVAQFKTTVLLLPNGSDRITGAPVQDAPTDKKVEDAELKTLLASSLKTKKKKKAAAAKAAA